MTESVDYGSQPPQRLHKADDSWIKKEDVATTPSATSAALLVMSPPPPSAPSSTTPAVKDETPVFGSAPLRPRSPKNVSSSSSEDTDESDIPTVVEQIPDQLPAAAEAVHAPPPPATLPSVPDKPTQTSPMDVDPSLITDNFVQAIDHDGFHPGDLSKLFKDDIQNSDHRVLEIQSSYQRVRNILYKYGGQKSLYIRHDKETPNTMHVVPMTPSPVRAHQRRRDLRLAGQRAHQRRR